MPFPRETLWMYFRNFMFLFITGGKTFWPVRVFRFTTQPCGVWTNEWAWQTVTALGRPLTWGYPGKDGGFHNSLLGSLKWLRCTNTVSGFAASHPTALTALFPLGLGLGPLVGMFSPLCSCTPTFNFHSLIYFHPKGPEVVPSVYPSILCLTSCPILLPIFYLLPAFSVCCSILPHVPVPSAPNPFV